METTLVMDRILLVDDDNDIVCCFKSILEDEGFLVYSANDADEAVRVMRDNEVQLAIMDYVLPETRGDSLAETLNEIDQKLKIIFVSGHLEVVDVINRLNCGVYGVFLKPVNPERLLNLVKTLQTDPLHAKQLIYPYMA